MPNTRNRVPIHTSDRVNTRIRRRTEDKLRHFSRNPDQIPQRLRALDKEWNIERAIEVNASALALAGLTLGVSHDRRWLALPALVSGFLFQHAVQGWCPPVPVLRRLGFRTAYEIEEERQALKALRGDFRGIAGKRSNKAPKALRAARTA